MALDPVFASLPAKLKREAGENPTPHLELEAMVSFCRGVLSVISAIVPAVKINSAYFEKYHADGVAAYDGLLAEATEKGLIVIGDIKRGDVGHTAEMYADAHLGAASTTANAAFHFADAVTINGYFGLDGVKPFVDSARQNGQGLFVLVRTSNKSAALIQDVVTSDGRKVHEIVGSEVERWAVELETIGRSGYSLIGAVVATRNAADAAQLRATMPRSIFLVPGYGAQGGKADDFSQYFGEGGMGAIIAAGRSVIFAHAEPVYRDKHGDDWKKCVENACRDFVADIGRVAFGAR